MRRSDILPIGIAALVLLPGCLGWGVGPAGPTNDAPAGDASAPSYENSSVRVRNGTEFLPGSEPHTHDFWNGRERVIIANRTLSFDDPNNLLGNEVTFLPDPGKSVLPGTAEIRLTLRWDGYADVSARYFFPGRWRVLTDSREMSSGETWRIPLNRSGWDVPHARRSLWEFTVRRSAFDVNTEIEATVTIHRSNRSLPLDPPHFDQFGGKDRKVLYDEELRVSDWMAPLRSHQGDPLVVFPPFGQAMDAVPPGTARIVVDIRWGSSPTGDPGYRLTYLTAHDTTDDRSATASERGADGARWAIEPSDDEADSPYAYHSRWEFRIWRPEGLEGSVPQGGSTFHIQVVAYRDA